MLEKGHEVLMVAAILSNHLKTFLARTVQLTSSASQNQDEPADGLVINILSQRINSVTDPWIP